MKIKLLVSRAGPDFVQSRGEEIDVPADEAARMIEAGQAEPIREPLIERAAKAIKAEKAVR